MKKHGAEMVLSASALVEGLTKKMDTLDRLEREIHSDTQLIMGRVENLREHIRSLVEFVSTIANIENAAILIKSAKKK